jgi:thymidylate synthase ThyX
MLEAMLEAMEEQVMYSAKVLADSVSPDGVRLTTLEVCLPRIVLSEFNTHRMLSRNSASSRAIPVEKRIKMIEEDPFIPEQFGKNQKGMQAEVDLEGTDGEQATATWLDAKDDAVKWARELAKLGVHKQLANRLLEPFAWHTVIVTATEWENFFNLRCNPDAQPEIRKAAELMRDAMAASKPRELTYKGWHLPLTTQDDAVLRTEDICKISVARCARVSYLTHDGKRDTQADLDLYERLVTSGHMSPLEHVARPMTNEEWTQSLQHEVTLTDGRVLWSRDSPRELEIDGLNIACVGREVHFCGNLNGWVQFRKTIPGEAVFRDRRNELGAK